MKAKLLLILLVIITCLSACRNEGTNDPKPTENETKGNKQTMEEYLIEKGVLSGERTQMASEMIGAKDGFKYGQTEIYEFDPESENYAKLKDGEAIGLEGMDIELKAIAINGNYALFGEASEELIQEFNNYK